MGEGEREEEEGRTRKTGKGKGNFKVRESTWKLKGHKHFHLL